MCKVSQYASDEKVNGRYYDGRMNMDVCMNGMEFNKRDGIQYGNGRQGQSLSLYSEGRRCGCGWFCR
jgi:hypothetical protein